MMMMNIVLQQFGLWYYYCVLVWYILGYLPRVEKCTTDSSWFVKQAAVDLITKILSSCIVNTSLQDVYKNVLSDEEEKMITTVFAPMMTDEGCDANQLSICLEILQNGELLNLIFSCWHLDKVQIVERLCTLLKLLPTCLLCDNERKILEVLSSVCDTYDYWTEAKRELILLAAALMNDGRILSAVVVAVWLTERFVALQHQISVVSE